MWRHAAGDIRGTFLDGNGRLLSTGFIPIAGGASVQTQPDVAFDGTRFIVVWTQDGNIRGARVDPAGGVVGGVTFDIMVAANTQNSPSIACKAMGTCMVVWSDGRVAGDLEIRGRRLDASGLPTGGDFSVSDLALGHEVAPDIAFADSNYFVVWQDQRLDADIYGSRVTDLGVALEPAGIAIGTANLGLAPSLAAIGKTVLVAWSEKVLLGDAMWSVRARRVDAAAPALLDAAPLDAAGAASSTGARPSVASTVSTFAVAWNEGTQLAARRMGADGVWDDPASVDLHSPETMGQARTGLASDGAGFLLLWDDAREPSAGVDIYGAALSDALARLLDDDTLVTPSLGTLNQRLPAIAWNGSDYLVVWEDRRRGGNADIIAATIDHMGSLTNPVAAVAHQNNAETAPDVAWGSGSWLVSWAHNNIVAGANDLYAVRVGTDADPIGSPVAISTSPGHQQAPAVAYDGTYFVVAFEDNAAGTFDIRAARVDGNGSVLDPGGVLVADGQVVQQDPDIAAVGGKTFIVWRHDIVTIPVIPKVYGTSFSTAGGVAMAGGTNLSGPEAQDQPAIASHGVDEVLVVSRQAGRIRGRKFDINAMPTVAAFNIGTGAPAESFPAVASDGFNWAVAWRDAGGAGDVRAELLRDSGAHFLGGGYSIAVTAAVEGDPAIAAAAPGVFMGVFQGAVAGGTLVQGMLLANDCCAGDPPAPRPGCWDLEVLDCVCNVVPDPWCCTSGWDDLCLNEAQVLCGLVCP